MIDDLLTIDLFCFQVQFIDSEGKTRSAHLADSMSVIKMYALLVNIEYERMQGNEWSFRNLRACRNLNLIHVERLQ